MLVDVAQNWFIYLEDDEILSKLLITFALIVFCFCYDKMLGEWIVCVDGTKVARMNVFDKK